MMSETIILDGVFNAHRLHRTRSIYSKIDLVLKTILKTNLGDEFECLTSVAGSCRTWIPELSD